jgi:hypothetical protein
VLDRVIKDDPAAFLRTVAQILPKEIDVALTMNSDLFVEARDFAAAYRLARQVIGADSNKLIELQANFAANVENEESEQ